MERSLSDVGVRVVQRRTELGMDAAQLARTAGVDPKTLASLEKGERWPRDSKRSAIERALRWNVGGIKRLREGLEPVADDEPDRPVERPVFMSKVPLEDILAEIQRRTEELSIAARRTDPKYGKGRSEQGVADGEENQDPGGI